MHNYFSNLKYFVLKCPKLTKQPGNFILEKHQIFAGTQILTAIMLARIFPCKNYMFSYLLVLLKQQDLQLKAYICISSL